MISIICENYRINSIFNNFFIAFIKLIERVEIISKKLLKRIIFERDYYFK